MIISKCPFGGTMPETVRSYALVITLCIACITGAWALAGELHNYRLATITVNMEKHENGIAANTLAINRLVTSTDSWQEDIDEIKKDVKTLLMQSASK